MGDVGVYVGDELAKYGFPHGHPFGTERQDAFWQTACAHGLDQQVRVCRPVQAPRDAIEAFHTPKYVERVFRFSAAGEGLLDFGDTPAFAGCYEAAATVVGSTLDAVGKILQGQLQRALVPIAGLHHAHRHVASGFCIFNDCGVAIETLRSTYGIQRVLYVDIDAHHGDGVFYAFEADPDVLIVDIHEDGRFLFPGSGAAEERGKGNALGSKVNIPMRRWADEKAFLKAWTKVQRFLAAAKPEFVILQAGADSLPGDPLTHLAYSVTCYATVARSLVQLADKHCQGRIVALGGGGYNPGNLGAAWNAVLKELLRGR